MLHDKEKMIKILDASIERTKDKPNMDDWSWGDFILSHAAAIIALRLGIGGSATMKMAFDLMTNKETVDRMIRLSEILTETEGFESMRIVQRNEAPDGALPSDEKKEVDDTFRRLLGLDKKD